MPLRPNVTRRLCLLFLPTAAAPAADRFWVGTNSNWDDPQNWSLTPTGPGDADIPDGGTNAYLVKSPTPNPVIPLPSRSDALFFDLFIGGAGTNVMTVLQTTQSVSANYVNVGAYGPGAYQQLGGTLQTNGLTLGSAAPTPFGTFLLAGGDLITQRQTIGFYSNNACSLTQTGGTNTTTYLEVDYNGHYNLTNGQLTSHLFTLAGHLEQTGGDQTADYLFVNGFGDFRWSAGTLRIRQGLSVDGTFQFPATPSTLDVEGFLALNNPAGLSNTHNASLHLGPNTILSHPASFDPTTAFASYANAGLDHIIGTTLVIPAQTSILSGGTINDPIDLFGSLASPTSIDGGLVLMNHITLHPGACLGADTVNDLDFQPGIGATRILGGQFRATRIYSTPTSITSAGTALFLQSAGDVQIGDLNLDTGSKYDLSGGTLTAGATELAGTFTAAAPRGEIHQTGGSYTTGSFTIYDARQAGGLLTVAAGSLTAQSLTVGGPVNDNTAKSPNSATFDIAGNAAQLHIGTLSLQQSARLSAVPGSTIHISTLTIASTNPLNFPGLSNLHLLFDTDSTQPQQLELAGADHGRNPTGFTDNFALATLEISTPLTLVDAIDNQPSRPGLDTLYVHDLILDPGSTLNLNGLSLYYDRLTNNGGTILPNNGSLLQIPEPALLALIPTCIPFIAMRRSRPSGPPKI